MLWWRRQTAIKKTLYMGAFISLAAGISAGKEALVGGVLLFFVFGLLGLSLPKTFKKTTDKEWQDKISPHVEGTDKIFRYLFSFVSLVLAIVSIYFMFQMLLRNVYGIALICGFASVALISSFVYLNPKIYNDFFITTKIVPLKKKQSTIDIYNKAAEIMTPFGTPLMGFVPNIKNPVGVYRIIDFGWIVYFYVHQGEIIIQANYINSQELDYKAADWVIIFIQQLADMFSYLENTGSLPDEHVTVKLFKPPYVNE